MEPNTWQAKVKNGAISFTSRNDTAELYHHRHRQTRMLDEKDAKLSSCEGLGDLCRRLLQGPNLG